VVNEILWAPWRANFIRNKKKLRGCLFCKILKKNDVNDRVLFRGKKNFIIINAFPYNTGHIMVVPYRHCQFGDMDENELAENSILVQKSIRAIKKALNPDGFNVGINIGKAASASIEHAHVHIVPRWVGDSGFMETAAGVKVMPESVKETYNRLKDSFSKIN
jgi:ATP adenylyltransferase